ncbi:hypothetical protein [Streptomyces sp. JJ38]|uniref:hypothetical protein n=1 Tax=Streptomyces sp. JJ38 TaxID=2738128 RepID=UPI001C598F84|nr:hypothetical protein [Streptomyces sp. JJ38]MBW1595631.1 hypothetical protein [Streptomyces sp. JJ38]
MPTCFALGTRTAFYEDVVRPVCRQLDLALIRADHVMENGALSESGIRHLTAADILVADLTGRSPEVVHGLRIRHAFGLYSVQLGETGAAPFADGMFPSIVHSALPVGSAEAREKLTAALAERFPEVLAAPRSGPYQPVTLAGRTAMTGTTRVPEQALGDACGKPVASEAEPPGLLDQVALAEAEMESIAEAMTEVEVAIADLAAMAEVSQEDIRRSGQPGTPMGARLAAVNRFAAAIEGPAEELEAAALRFAERMKVTVDVTGAGIQWVRDMPRADWPDGTVRMLDQVVEMAGDIREAASGMQGLRQLLAMFGTMSSRARKPTRKIGKAVEAMFGSVVELEQWAHVARELKVE